MREKLEEKIEEKKKLRESIEGVVHYNIQQGKELHKKDLDNIFALSIAISSLEELL